MAYAQRVGITTTTQTSSSTSVVVTIPAGVQDGDELRVAITAPNADTWTVPGGWTEELNHASGTNPRTRVWRRTASSEPASYTWTSSTSRPYVAVCFAMRGDPTTPVDVSGGQGTASSTSAVAPTVTTTVDECLLVVIFGATYGAGTSGTCTPPSGMTEWADVCTASGSAANRHLAVYFEEIATAGATGTRTGTLSTASANTGQVLAFRPVPASPSVERPRDAAKALRETARRAAHDRRLAARRFTSVQPAVGALLDGADHIADGTSVVTITSSGDATVTPASGVTADATSPVLIGASGTLLVDRLADAISPVLIGAAGDLLVNRLADATSVVVVLAAGAATVSPAPGTVTADGTSVVVVLSSGAGTVTAWVPTLGAGWKVAMRGGYRWLPVIRDLT